MALSVGLLSAAVAVHAQDATWDGFINAGRAALQQDQFADAERHFEQALEAAESFPPGDPRLGRSLNNLAAVYYKQKDYDRAEPLMRRSLSVLTESLGRDNADVAQTQKNLAAIYYLQGNYADAEPLLQESLSTLERLHGPNHAYVATVLNNLAALYQTQDRYVDAEPLLSRSLGIWEGLLGPNHQDVIKSRELLAKLREVNSQAGDGAEPQEAAAVPPSSDQAEIIEPQKAREIIALAAEAEAEADAAEDAGGGARDLAPALSETQRQNDIDAVTRENAIDEATRALENLTASETAAAAAARSGASASEANGLPAPVIRTAALPNAVESGTSAAGASFAIYLSTLWSEDEAKRYWHALRQEIPDILADKELELEEVAFAEGGGSFYRVLTTSFPTDPAAQEVCDAIKSQVRTHDCNVVAR